MHARRCRSSTHARVHERTHALTRALAERDWLTGALAHRLTARGARSAFALRRGGALEHDGVAEGVAAQRAVHGAAVEIQRRRRVDAELGAGGDVLADCRARR